MIDDKALIKVENIWEKETCLENGKFPFESKVRESKNS